jgi:hypothetical protein
MGHVANVAVTDKDEQEKSNQGFTIPQTKHSLPVTRLRGNRVWTGGPIGVSVLIIHSDCSEG